jgi:hypothetical protein
LAIPANLTAIPMNSIYWYTYGRDARTECRPNAAE